MTPPTTPAQSDDDSSFSPELSIPPLPPIGRNSNNNGAKYYHWLITLAIAGLLLLVLSRTFKSSQTPASQQEAKTVEKIREALLTTKFEYISPSELQENTVNTSASSPAIRHPSAFKKFPLMLKPVIKTQRKQKKAADIWYELAHSSPDSPGIWRRLGITFFLSKRTGGMEAFRHISDIHIPKSPLSLTDRRKGVESRDTLPLLPPAEERALWTAIYGDEKLTPVMARRIRPKLHSLKLDWFENIALAQLYDKAGMKAEAEKARNEARASAKLASTIQNLYVSLVLIGFFSLIAYIIVQTYNRVMPKSQPVASGDGSDNINSHNTTLQAPIPQFDFRSWTHNLFSYRSQMLSFVVYYSSFLLMGFIGSRLFHLFAPNIEQWTDELRMRVSIVFQLALFIPIVFVTLLTLRHLSRRETKRAVTMRDVLHGIGFRFDKPLTDLFTGVAGYVIILPIFLALSILSVKLFDKFPSPVNPVEIDTIVSKGLIERILLLIEAAVAAPLIEEMMFRGLLFQAIKMRRGVLGGALVSAAVFALSHNTLPNGFLPIGFLGIAFAYAQQQRGSILPNIVMHSIHNGLILLMTFATFSQ